MSHETCYDRACIVTVRSYNCTQIWLYVLVHAVEAEVTIKQQTKQKEVKTHRKVTCTTTHLPDKLLHIR